MQQDLDARLVFVVAPAFEVVDAQDRLGIGEQVALRQEIADLTANKRGAAEPAADIDGEAELALPVAHDLQADVVGLDDGAVVRRAVDGDLELARQERELRVQRRPLPQYLGEGARIGELVGRHAGVMVGGDVADAVSRSLDRVHLDAGEFGEDVGHVLQRRPVELQVLTRGEMAVAAVVLARDVGELAHLAGVQRAVGHGDAQHVGVQLQIEAVHQPMRSKLVLGQFAGQPPVDLIAELIDPRGDERRVEFVIAIHAASPSARARRRSAQSPQPACRGHGARSGLWRGSPRAAPLARNGRCATRPRSHRGRR